MMNLSVAFSFRDSLGTSDVGISWLDRPARMLASHGSAHRIASVNAWFASRGWIPPAVRLLPRFLFKLGCHLLPSADFEPSHPCIPSRQALIVPQFLSKCRLSVPK